MDGDGKISIHEVETFFASQHERMQAYSQELVLFQDVLCQLIDMIHPENGASDECRRVFGGSTDGFEPLLQINLKILNFLPLPVCVPCSAAFFTRRDLKRSSMAPLFFNAIFNLSK